jgi:hypothetical protein
MMPILDHLIPENYGGRKRKREADGTTDILDCRGRNLTECRKRQKLWFCRWGAMMLMEEE